MKNVQKRNKLNRMNSSAYAVKLGNVLPFAVVKHATAENVTEGRVEIDTEIPFSAVCSVCVLSKEGAVKAVTSVSKKADSETVAIVEVSSLAAEDVVTLTVL